MSTNNRDETTIRTRQHETTEMPDQKKTNSKIPVGPTKDRAMHYKNTPIQIYWKFYNLKKENFQINDSDIFHIFTQNIDCGFSRRFYRVATIYVF